MGWIRRTGNVSLIIAVVVTLLASATAVSSTSNAPNISWTKARVNGQLVAPSTANPYLAFTPEAPDYQSWDTYYTHVATERRSERARPPRGPRSPQVNERPGRNDRPQGAQRVFVDTDASGAGGIDILGRGPDPIEITTTEVGFAEELNGSIPDAQVLPVLSLGDQVTGSGTIGDEDEFDFDFFALPGLKAGDVITIDITTPIPLGFDDLDPSLTFWDGNSTEPLEYNEDKSFDNWDSFLQVTIPNDGTFYFAVGSFFAFWPEDPFDSDSPSITGEPGIEGTYDFTVSSINLDVDFFKFDLEEGDVFGAAAFDGAQRLELYNAAGELLIGSSQDLTGIHPEASPLPGGGNAALSYVIDEPGRHYLGVISNSDYLGELRNFRPSGDVPGRDSQVIFLDFDGGSFDIAIFGAPESDIRTLSPLVDFLPNWGLGPEDEDAVIDAIVASVAESLQSDIEELGGNEAYDIVLLNSKDHEEPTGPLVSRIIVGGTIPEADIGTVGIAQSIDVGNFETEETAIVLLDLLSATEESELFIPSVSINTYPLAPGVSIIDAIGVGVGNITAHEAGHFLANWHTDQFNDNANIMDQGGNFPNTFGVGEDGIFGSADDVDVDFGADVYVSNEGFTGTENTLTSVAFGLWSVSG